jgi:hypothetical protein
VTQYQRLDPVFVRKTVHSVEDRIRARFPNRALGDVANEVGSAVGRAQSAGLQTPVLRVVRYVCGALAYTTAAATMVAIVIVTRDGLRRVTARSSFDWLPVIESAINDVAFAGIAIAFLLTVSNRLDRRAVLAELHRLRSLAHVIDMHQLTKDPERSLSHPEPTSASVVETLTSAELGRYLDYCSELLSLVSKTAALYAQASTDGRVLETVSEIESLTSGMSRKIWQKISLLHS